MEKIEWHAPEYIFTEKTTDWYWVVGIITVSVALIAIIVGNLIFALLILISIGTLALFASRRPEIIRIEINDRDILIGENVYEYPQIESFWVESRDAYPRLFLRPRKKIAQHMVVLIEDVNPRDVRDILATHLTETEHTEPLLEKLFIYFGF
ncbi:MAG: hypothetical protein WCK48_01755 [bacterium]